MDKGRFVSTAFSFGITVYPEALSRFKTYERELITWTKRMNLIAKGDEAKVWTRHFLDSLMGWSKSRSLIPNPYPLKPAVIDIGTGAGFPGLPIKIVWPEIKLTLLESVRKKTLFLKHLVETLNLKEVNVLNTRAEALAKDKNQAGQYDVALSRAVGNIPDLIKLSFPFLKDQGHLIAWCGEETLLSFESRVTNHESRSYSLPGKTRTRHILILTKGGTSHES